MDEKNIVEERAAELAKRIHLRNTEDAVEFYKSLASMDTRPIAKALLDEDSASRSISDAESLLKKKIEELREGGGDVPLGRYSVALFIIDRTKKIRNLVIKQDINSLFSLFVSLRGRIEQMLSESYYGMKEEEALDEYIATEPLIRALSDLCDLSMPTMNEIVSNYRF
jgi:hypothetical protein